MAHEHQVIDQDKHFVIDPITRKIKSLTPEKNSLVRYDHNSERFTFEIPRYVDGHDMSLCNIIQIHYINISNNKVDTSSDVYETTDMYISDDDKTIIFSWLISRNATQYYGSLSFAIRFACTTEDIIDYDWHTDIYSGISISNSINNSNVILEDYLDVLENWRITVAEDMVGRKMDKENPTGTGSFSMNRLKDTTIGYNSHAEGSNTTASGGCSHAEGADTIASGECSHAEGDRTTASNINSHAEGVSTAASGSCSHAEGDTTTADGNFSHSEGLSTIANGECSHAEGRGTIASGDNQHVQGKFNVEDTENEYAHIVGGGTSYTDRKNIHTVDWSGNATFAGDVINGNGVSLDSLNSGKANSSHTHAISDVSGLQSALDGKAASSHSHAISDVTGLQNSLDGKANSSHSHAISDVTGLQNSLSDCFTSSQARTANTVLAAPNGSNGGASFRALVAEDLPSHSHDYVTKSNPSSSGTLSHNGSATGEKAIALGHSSTASGQYSVAVGAYSTASGYSSIALVDDSTANGNRAVAAGGETIALDYQLATGWYNNTSTATAGAGAGAGSGSGTSFVIGNGSHEYSRSNALRVRADGQIYSPKTTVLTGADYAEYFEWADNNENCEDRVGHFVTFDENNPEKIRFANEGDYILGVVSGLPSVIGNGDEDWRKRYITDDFGRYIEESFEYEEEIITGYSEIGEPIIERKTKQGIKWKENPKYDNSKIYISRDERPEWAAVGMLGTLSVYDDGTCEVNRYCKCSNDGIATKTDEKSGYIVIKRITDNIVKVILK